MGKTVLIEQVLTKALDSGWPASNIAFFDFKDERLIESPASPDEIVSQMPPADPRAPRLLFLDEVTRARHWWTWLGRAVDQGLRVVMADSSAAALRAQRQTGDSQQGRWTEIRLEGLSFTEFLRLRHRDEVPHMSAWGPELRQYLALGGFPEHARAVGHEEVWTKVRQDTVERAIGVDLRKQGIDVSRAEALFKYLVQSSGAQFDLRKVCDLLHGASQNTVRAWLAAIETTLLVARLDAREARSAKRVSARLKPKIYAADPGLISAFALPSERSAIRPALFEACVFKLLREYFDSHRLFFVAQPRSAPKGRGEEIDFLVEADRRIAIEVTSGADGNDKANSLHSRAADFTPHRMMVVYDGTVEGEHHGVAVVPLHVLLAQPERFLS